VQIGTTRTAMSWARWRSARAWCDAGLNRVCMATWLLDGNQTRCDLAREVMQAELRGLGYGLRGGRAKKKLCTSRGDAGPCRGTVPKSAQKKTLTTSPPLAHPSLSTPQDQHTAGACISVIECIAVGECIGWVAHRRRHVAVCWPEAASQLIGVSRGLETVS
jgi:hypothetical protein